MTADLHAIAERLFEGVMAPLVLGGALVPGKPIGARAAIALAEGEADAPRVVSDPERLSHVQLGRVRIARRLVPIDRFEGPSAAEWILSAALHDIVQAAHPKLAGTFRRSAPSHLLSLVEATLAQVPAPSSVAAALSRHTWFSRALEITRTDTVISWWVGSSSFRGETPPARLTAWPELRRVNVDSSERALVDLPSAGAGASVDHVYFTSTLAKWLTRTPLTDVATCTRAAPAFAWTPESLALLATRPGRTLALRALALQADVASVDRALGAATKRLLAARAWKHAMVALDLLAERALTEAQLPLRPPAREPNADATFARAAGALAARSLLDATPLNAAERLHITRALDHARAAAPDLDAVLAPLLNA